MLKSLKSRRRLVVFLLIIVSILFRIQYKFPHHPDHFIWGNYASIIINKGFAPWVLHPLSLFGYYPFSIPSGFEFFSSFLSIITGIKLPSIFFFFSIFIGLFGGFTLFVMMRKWTNYYVSLLSSFVLLTMAFFSKVTSNTASSRILNIVFYPLFILVLFKIFEKWNETKKISWKYVGTNAFLFLLMMVIHRLAQFLVIFIVSAIIAFLLLKWEKILERLKRTILFKKREKKYEQSRVHVVLDILFIFTLIIGYLMIRSKIIFFLFFLICINYFYFFNYKKTKKISLHFVDFWFYVFLVFLGKIMDLYNRGRLYVYFDKIKSIKLLEEYSFFVEPYVVGFLILLFLSIGAYIILKRKLIVHTLDNVSSFIEKKTSKFFYYFEEEPERFISIALVGIFLFFLVSVFFSGGFLGMDSSHYSSSFLLKGENPAIIFINFLLNLNNNLTILIWFGFAGVLFLFFKKNKTFYDLFFCLVLIFFTQIMLDWEYGRLYMNPLYAMIVGFGMYEIYCYVRGMKKTFRTLGIIFIISIISFHFIVSNAMMHRDEIDSLFGLEEKWDIILHEEYISAGNYLSKTSNDEFSIATTHWKVRAQRTSFYANKVEAGVSQNVYLNQYFNITRIPFSEIWQDFSSGLKIRQLYVAKDIIFKGDYYFGKYLNYAYDYDLNEEYIQDILKMHNMKYVLDSELVEEKNNLFISVSEQKDKVYSSPGLSLYHLELE